MTAFITEQEKSRLKKQQNNRFLVFKGFCELTNAEYKITTHKHNEK